MRVLITAGGTSEPIDAVRAIKNEATGKLGLLIAEELLNTYDDIEIDYIHDVKAHVPTDKRVSCYRVETVADLEREMKRLIRAKTVDVVIHSMAVSDYKTETALTSDALQHIFEQWNMGHTELMTYVDFQRQLLNYAYTPHQKLGSKHEKLFIALTKTPKIIEQIKRWNPQVKLIGFKLLHDVKKEELIDIAYQQLVQNDEMLVVANDKQDIHGDEHIAFIIDKKKNYQICTTKQEIAARLVARINEM